MYFTFFIIIIFFLILSISIDKKQKKQIKINKKYNSNPNINKDITPEFVLNKNTNKKIAIVYFYTENILNFAQHSIHNIKHYCSIHNYAFIVYNKPLNNDVKLCWNKIAVILNHLNQYKYIIWIDADAIIVQHNITFEEIIKKYQDIDLLLCSDIFFKKECINSGVMIIKNTEWSYQLFKKVWNNNKFEKGHNDQRVLLYEITKELYPESEPTLIFNQFCMLGKIHPKVMIFKENYFNTNILRYRSGDFILHLMGTNNFDRVFIMRQINTKLGLDDFKNLDCINLINNKDDFKNRNTEIFNKCIKFSIRKRIINFLFL